MGSKNVEKCPAAKTQRDVARAGRELGCGAVGVALNVGAAVGVQRGYWGLE